LRKNLDNDSHKLAAAMPTHYLAIDLGAESGRVMLGTLEDGRIRLEELHRFANTPGNTHGALTWNIAGLFEEVKSGLRKAAARGLPFAGLSIDSWGVDYMLFDEAGALIPPIFHYRDARAAHGVENAKARVDWKTIFDETGIQFMALNTIFQLAAESPERLGRAAQMLTIADGFHRMLCGVGCIDESNASTTQLYNPRSRQWSKKLIGALGLPERMFPRIVPCGSRLGPLSAEILRETDLPPVQVIASCSHDTGAAVAAVPATGGNWAYLSSGTWSLMGAELSSPVITETCRELNFTNEIGYGSTVRLLKNIVGLWLVQECRREWAAAGEDFDYGTLTKLAAEATPFVSLINPADARFIAPGQMPRKIAAFCRETGQPEPATPGATIRCALESLALLYRRTLRQLEQLLGSLHLQKVDAHRGHDAGRDALLRVQADRQVGPTSFKGMKLERLHIVGGGSRNALLNQLTANAVQIPVVAGPAEATALGNVAVQALALGHLPSLAAARNVIRASFEPTTYQPESAADWEKQFARFDRLLANA
jgi:rhamnulokinase